MGKKAHVFCVEDDKEIRELMLYTLRASGFDATGFEDAASFLDAVAKTIPDVVMLDIMLPDEDGISLLRKIRRDPRLSDLPVIMATAKASEYDKVTGLDSGADEYLTKPFGMMEMVSHIRALLRRVSPKKQTPPLVCGRIELDDAGHRVTLAGKPLELTLKEYDLLRLFMSRPGQVFTRESLLSSVWHNDYPGETRTVDVHIASLRMKMGDWGRHIETVRGVGYRFEAGRVKTDL